MKKINIGGQFSISRFPEGWECVDILPGADYVCDISKEKLPFDDNSVDCIYFSHCLEHIIEERHAFVLSEMKRVLKSDGILRVVVPDMDLAINSIFKERKKGNPIIMKSMLRWWFDYDLDDDGNPVLSHVTGFDCDSLKKLLKDNGFKKIIKKSYVDYSPMFKDCDNPLHKPTSIYYEASK